MGPAVEHRSDSLKPLHKPMAAVELSSKSRSASLEPHKQATAKLVSSQPKADTDSSSHLSDKCGSKGSVHDDKCGSKGSVHDGVVQDVVSTLLEDGLDDLGRWKKLRALLPDLSDTKLNALIASTSA